MLCRGNQVLLWVVGVLSKVVVSLSTRLRAPLGDWVASTGVNYDALSDGRTGVGKVAHDSSTGIEDWIVTPTRGQNSDFGECIEAVTDAGVDAECLTKEKMLKEGEGTQAQSGKGIIFLSKTTNNTSTRVSVWFACIDRTSILRKALNIKMLLQEGGGREVSKSSLRNIMHKSNRCGVRLDGTEAKNFTEFANL